MSRIQAYDYPALCGVTAARVATATPHSPPPPLMRQLWWQLSLSTQEILHTDERSDCHQIRNYVAGLDQEPEGNLARGMLPTC
jgi:hypothetical protein